MPDTLPVTHGEPAEPGSPGKTAMAAVTMHLLTEKNYRLRSLHLTILLGGHLPLQATYKTMYRHL